MKIFYTLLSVLLMSAAVAAQETQDSEIGKYFVFDGRFHILEVAVAEDADREEEVQPLSLDLLETEEFLAATTDIAYNFTGVKKPIYAGLMFQIIDTHNGFYIIELENDGISEKLFAITAFQKESYTSLFRGDIPVISFVSSALIIPIKIRPGDGSRETNVIDENGKRTRFSNFEGNVNAGVTAGVRLRVHPNGRSFVNTITGISLGTTKITNETAAVTSEINATTLSPFLGMLFEYDSFQVGAFLGWDNIGGSVGRTWVYQGKPWLGIGLGYKIFSSKKPTGTN